MSRSSDAKKARRRKRQTARDVAWIPEPVYENLRAADDAEAISEAVADVDEWITDRGWLLDTENSEVLVSWVYPPSATEFVDDIREPVTRLWITAAEDGDAVVLEFGAALVGAGGTDDSYLLDPDTLAEDIAALEAYRPGLARPEFG